LLIGSLVKVLPMKIASDMPIEISPKMTPSWLAIKMRNLNAERSGG
jgi:hypothetical protein